MSDNLVSLFSEFQTTSQEGFENNNPEFRNSSNRISILPNTIRTWKPVKGKESRIRFFPQIKKSYFAEETRGHYKVGAAGHSFACPHMNMEQCPLCDYAKEKYTQATEITDEDKVKEIRGVAKQFNGVIYHIAYMIDRNDMNKGVQAYCMTNGAIESIRAQLTDENGKIYPHDHPAAGHDIMFTLEDKKDFAKIVGVKIARTPTAITWDPKANTDMAEKAEEWIKFIKDHPIRDMLRFISQEEMSEYAFGSMVTSSKSSSQASSSSSVASSASQGSGHSSNTPSVEEAFAESLKSSNSSTSTEDEVDFDAKMAEMQAKLSGSN